MDDEDENLTTFLAYTKSPKITKRTSFQDELKKAVSARVSRQQAVEEAEYSDYSEEFESDDSLDDSFGKTKLIQSKKQKDLQNFHFSDTEEDLYGKTSFLKKSKQDKSFSKYSDKSKSSENVSQGDFGESRLADDVKTQHRPDDNERKPIPKPRKSSINSPPSWQGLGISLSDKSFKPTPQHRNLSGKSSHLEDKAEGKRSSDKTTSLSAPSSLMRLNDKVSASMTQSFSERCSPEGDRLSSPPSPTSRFRPLSVAADMNNKTISKEDRAEILKDLQMGKVGTHVNMDSSGSGRKSPSLFEMMISDVKEKSLSQDTKDPFSVKSHEKRPFGEQREDNDKTQQHDKQLDHQKNLKGTLDLGGSQSNRSFSAPQTKKTPKQSTQVSARSRYLGTLAILDTSGNKESGDVEAADMLRATVYQNWLEKKKSFLQELQKTKKAEEQLEKEKARQDSSMKKEEAIAAFMAWKAEKKKQIKQSQTKQKIEEKKKIEEFQETLHRGEDCKKAFEKWKEAKEDHLKEKILKEKHAEREKKTKEQKAVKEKERENLSAFKKWNDRKEHVLKDKKKQEMYENQKLKSLQAEKEEKDKKAMEVYEQWLERKEWQEKIERKQKKKKVILDSDPPPPWSPPGKTIPAGR
ncbi:microtubule-associated protein 9 isoform X1 [Dendropsophus ebraccatus]|uniref:microtubule-associated protein 9 isoform X1 n=1 Tax=Dendropsophus ebraccatus TaxID=150705 RepID=UPI003831D0BB